ncbi:cobyric acid synthase [Halobaculum sp. CBA1158]|uniref:cobyric acid synthase n=1 Tax=Halobaculum sp. CBA1158 TaxID=2904243 RepID=UPI001F42C233|nr:cobyric acid synthase [Halobaculum sp. CBA1158]UIP00288.1 cobyric acid synthase [Halobaculum sp. CBA1158]
MAGRDEHGRDGDADCDEHGDGDDPDDCNGPDGDAGDGSASAHTLLVAGTASHVGKSTVAAGLCRRLADAGVSVAPFKAQNMSNNARAVVHPDGGYGEVGVSQAVQARAAGVTPTTDHNPVLLKPRGDGESQLVIDGEAVGHYEAGAYYDEYWERAREAVVDAHARLAADHDVIVAEGAGSIAEINLHDRDLANVETARAADASILLVGDIERGGVFASLYGSLELMPADLRERVAGAVITKFRGDPAILESGLAEFEDRTGVPVLDVIPYDDPGLPEEDSVALPAVGERAVVGDDDGVPAERSVTVAVPRLPRASNVTDLGPLSRTPGVRVAYVPPDGDLDGAGAGANADADGVVIPGTKNTVDDLLALREGGLADAIVEFDGPILGICGGYQLLGERITNADIEGTGDAEAVEGLGLLPVVTRFREDKRVRRTETTVDGCGPLAGASGRVSGYEIHMGRSERVGDAGTPVEPGSAAVGAVAGTYLHGVLDAATTRDAFLASVFAHAGVDRPDSRGRTRSPYAAAADLVAGVDLDALGVDPAAAGDRATGGDEGGVGVASDGE